MLNTMNNLTATCIDNKDYEWLLNTNQMYNVTSWTDKLIVIVHKRYGKFGLFRDRFMFNPPTENVKRVLEYGRYKYFSK